MLPQSRTQAAATMAANIVRSFGRGI